jgi:4-hydroxybenzoate polyprenyltransferase
MVPILTDAGTGGSSFASFAGLVVLLALLGLFGYLLNDWADREADRLVGKRNAFHRASTRRACLVLGGILIGGLAVGATVCRTWDTRVLVVIQILISFAYSHPPFRLKGRGALGLVAVLWAQYLIPTALVLSLFSKGIAADWMFWMSFAVTNGLCLEIGHQLFDRERDRRAGISTFGARIRSEPLCRTYRLLRDGLGVLIGLVPFYVSWRLLTASWGWLMACLTFPLLIVTGVASVSLRAAWRTYLSRTYDPYFDDGWTIVDRWYTYFPNCFVPAYLGVLVLPAVTSDWRFAVLMLVWVRLSLPLTPTSTHLKDLGAMFWPPALHRVYLPRKS